jgi:hypothetical protein
LARPPWEKGQQNSQLAHRALLRHAGSVERGGGPALQNLFMCWLDRPVVVVSADPFVMAGKGLPWTRFNLAELDWAEVLSEAEFRQRFNTWGLPDLPIAKRDTPPKLSANRPLRTAPASPSVRLMPQTV